MNLALNASDINSFWLLVGVAVGAGIVLTVQWLQGRRK